MVLLSSEFKNYQIYPHASESTLNRRSYAWSHSDRIGAVVLLLNAPLCLRADFCTITCPALTENLGRDWSPWLDTLLLLLLSKCEEFDAAPSTPLVTLGFAGFAHRYCELSDMQFSTTHVTPKYRDALNPQNSDPLTKATLLVAWASLDDALVLEKNTNLEEFCDTFDSEYCKIILSLIWKEQKIERSCVIFPHMGHTSWLSQWPQLALPLPSPPPPAPPCRDVLRYYCFVTDFESVRSTVFYLHFITHNDNNFIFLHSWNIVRSHPLFATLTIVTARNSYRRQDHQRQMEPHIPLASCFLSCRSHVTLPILFL